MGRNCYIGIYQSSSSQTACTDNRHIAKDSKIVKTCFAQTSCKRQELKNPFNTVGMSPEMIRSVIIFQIFSHVGTGLSFLFWSIIHLMRKPPLPSLQNTDLLICVID